MRTLILTVQITTSMDRDRRAKLAVIGEFDDPSGIRKGDWSSAWDECLTWTMKAWEEYLAYPVS